jgi:hypothetical protein
MLASLLAALKVVQVALMVLLLVLLPLQNHHREPLFTSLSASALSASALSASSGQFMITTSLSSTASL